MKYTSFFNFIDEKISASDQKKLFESLRMDPILWAAFVDLPMAQKVVDIFGHNVGTWQIGSISLLSLNLTTEILVKPVADKLYLKKAINLFESIRNGSDQVQNIKQATLLALALYERGQSTGTWRGIIGELGLNRFESRTEFVEAWRTSLAILYSLTNYSPELLAALAAENDENISISLINHIVAVQIKPNSEKAATIKELVEKSTPVRQISWYQSFPTQLGVLIAELTQILRQPVQFKFNQEGTNFSSFKAIEERIQEHILHGYKSSLENSHHQARAHFKAARDVTERLQNFIDLLVIDSNDDDNHPGGDENDIADIEFAHKKSLRKSLWAQNHDIGNKLTNCIQVQEGGEEGRARELGLSEFRQWLTDRKRNWPAIDEIELMQKTNHREILEALSVLDLDEMIKEYLTFLESISKNNPVIARLLIDNIHQITDTEEQYEKYKVSARIDPENRTVQEHLFKLLEQKKDWESLYLEWQASESKGGLDQNDWFSYANAACHAGKIDHAKGLCVKFEEAGMDQALLDAVKGKIQFLEGNHELAKELIQNALKQNSNNAEAWLTLAEIYQNEEDFSTAISTLKSAVLAVPESNAIHYAMGKVCLLQNMFAEALPYLRKAVALNTENEYYFIDLITTLSELGHLEESQKYLAKSRAKWPLQRELAYLDAQKNLEKGNKEQALIAFEVAVRGNEKVDSAWLIEYAQTLLDDTEHQFSLADNKSISMENLLAAQKSLQAALVQLPARQSYARILLAEVLYSLGEYEASHSSYIELTDYSQKRDSDLDIWDWRIKAGLGMVKLSVDEKEMGLVLLKEATRLNPEHLAIKHILAEAYHDAKLDDEAMHIAQEAYILCATDIRNLTWYANFMKKMNHSDEVIKALENANLISMDNPELTLQLASEYVVVGNIQGANSALERILKSNNADYPTLRELTLIYLRLGNQTGALQAYMRALSVISPLNLENQIEYIYLSLLNNHFQEALDQIQRLIAQNYTFAATFSMQAEALQGLKQYTPAMQAYDQALQNKKKLSDYLKVKNQADFFVPQAWIYSMEENEITLTRLASCAIKANAFEKSSNSINQVIHLQPANIAYKLFAADISLQLNDLETATTYLKMVYNQKQYEGDEILKPLMLAFNFLLQRFQGIKPIMADAEEVFKNPLSELLQIIKMVEENEFQNALKAYSHFQNQIDYEKFAVSETKSQVLLSQVWKSMLYRLAILASVDLYEFEAASQLLRRWKNDAGTEIETSLYSILLISSYRCFNGLFTHLGVKHHLSNSIEKQLKNPGVMEQLFAQASQQGETELITNFASLVLPSSRQAPIELNNILLSSDFLPSQKYLVIDRMFSEHLDQAIENYMHSSAPTAKDFVVYAAHFLTQAPHKIVAKYAESDNKVDPLISMVLSRGYSSLTNYEAAMEHCDLALQTWPEEQDWKVEKAQLFDALGEGEKAIAQWETVLKEAPSIKDVIFPYIETLLRSGKSTEALKMLEQYKGELSSGFDFHLYQSRAFLLGGMTDDALRSAQLARTIAPADISAILHEGQIWLKLHQFEKAMQNSNQVIQTDPGCIEGQLLSIAVLEAQGKFQEAIRIAEKGLASSPASHELKMSMAWNMRDVGRLVEAINLVSAMTVENEQDWEALSLLALLYNDLEDYRAAQDCAKKSLRIVMDQPGILMLLGGLLKGQGHLDQALEYFSRAAAINSVDIEPCLALGDIYFEQQNYPNALDAFQEAIQRDENDARSYHKTGLIMKEVKDYQGAEKMLRIAANLSPKDINLRRQLAGVIALNFVHSPLEAK